MADKKISQLTSATTPLAGSEVLPIVQGGSTVKVSVDNLTAGKSVTANSFIPTSSTIPTNGIFLGAANSVSVATNSVEHWTVNASGNFNPVGAKGIGTTLAPVSTLVATNATVSGGTLSLTGNQSVAAWTTSGIKLRGGGSTLTDTSSSGTVAAAYTNVLGGNTIAATNVTTFTDYISTYISDPIAGANVTLTNKWSLGTEGAAKIGGVVNAPGYQLASGGLITESTTSRNLSAGDNGKIIYCTSGSATTINCTAGLGAGFSVTIIQGGAGKVTVAANGQTLVSYSSLFSTMGQYAVISLICPAANTFVAAGNLGV